MMNREIKIAIGLEAIYQVVHATCIRAGVYVDREGFINTPGLPLITPLAAVELAAAGLAVVGFQAILQIPTNNPPRPRGAPNGRILS